MADNKRKYSKSYVDKLRSALRFYADHSKWQSGGRFTRPSILRDMGQRAREALGKRANL